jgi:hypothetical protein
MSNLAGYPILDPIAALIAEFVAVAPSLSRQA